MQQKQLLLREKILQKGFDPSKFYEYWQSLGLDFQTVEYQQLKIIVQTYVQTYLKHKQSNKDDDQFDDYQGIQQNHSHNQNLVNSHQNNQLQKDVYADFDWDLLMGINSTKTQQMNQKQKKQIKKLPKQFDKKVIRQNNQSNNEKKQKQSKNLNNSQTQNLNLIQIENLDISLITTKPNRLQDNSISQNKAQKSFTINFKDIQTQSKKQKIKCLKLQQNILNHHKNVSITITNVQQVSQQGSLMNKLWKGKDYIYTIKTIGRNKNRSIGVSWEVKKKYSDFQWLRNTLLKFYPGIIIPPMPSFPKSIQKIPSQKSKMENFLMDAYRCPELRNSKYFQVFLSYGNFSDFEGFKKSTQTVSKPKDLSSILNMKGQIQLLYGSNIQQFSSGIQQYLNKSSQHLKNVKSILNQIKGFYQSISSCYNRLSQVFELMSQQSCEFSQQKCFPRLTQTYKQISSLISKHSSFCQQQKSNIQSSMMSNFSYQKDRIDNIFSLISKRNQFIVQLNKKQPLKSSQSSTSTSMFTKFTGGVTSLFGQKTQSLDIPSSNYQKLLKQVGFYNTQLVNETIRCVEGMIQSQIQHFSEYGSNRIDSVDKLQKIWSEIMVELSKLNLLEKK